MLAVPVILGEAGKPYCWVSASGNGMVAVENGIKSSLLVSGIVILPYFGSSLSCLLLLCHSAIKRLASLLLLGEVLEGEM